MTEKHIYYMTQRPPMPGAMPIYGLIDVEEYNRKSFVAQINASAWAKLTYNRKLKVQEISDYELMPESYTVRMTRVQMIRLMSHLEGNELLDEDAEAIHNAILDGEAD